MYLLTLLCRSRAIKENKWAISSRSLNHKTRLGGADKGDQSGVRETDNQVPSCKTTASQSLFRRQVPGVVAMVSVSEALTGVSFMILGDTRASDCSLAPVTFPNLALMAARDFMQVYRYVWGLIDASKFTRLPNSGTSDISVNNASHKDTHS